MIKRYLLEGILISWTTNGSQPSKRISFDRMRNTSKFLTISISAFESKRVHRNNRPITMSFLLNISPMHIMKICKLIQQMRISRSSRYLIRILSIFLSWLCSRFPTPYEHKQRGSIRMQRANNSNNKIIHSEKKTQIHPKTDYNKLKRSAKKQAAMRALKNRESYRLYLL